MGITDEPKGLRDAVKGIVVAFICNTAFIVLSFIWFGWRVGTLCAIGQVGLQSSLGWRHQCLIIKMNLDKER